MMIDESINNSKIKTCPSQLYLSPHVTLFHFLWVSRGLGHFFHTLFITSFKCYHVSMHSVGPVQNFLAKILDVTGGSLHDSDSYGQFQKNYSWRCEELATCFYYFEYDYLVKIDANQKNEKIRKNTTDSFKNRV